MGRDHNGVMMREKRERGWWWWRRFEKRQEKKTKPPLPAALFYFPFSLLGDRERRGREGERGREARVTKRNLVL